MDLIFIAHLIATSIMVGVIWIVQLVHYPSFKVIDSNRFLEFENFHCKRISFVVMPAMLIEILSGGFIYLYLTRELLFIVSLIILIVIWISTFFIQATLHSKLLLNYSEENVNLLIKSNWVRTLLWSARILILIELTEIT
jgi:hypothetical protein